MKSYNSFPVLSGHNLKPPLQLPSPTSSWHKGLDQIKSLLIIYPTSWMNSSSLSYMVDFCYPISISLLLVGASQFCWKNIPFFHWLSFSGTTSQSVLCGHFTQGGPFGHLLMKFETQAERLKVVGVDSSSRGRLAEMVHQFPPTSCPRAA